jgi:hypothetical protein
MYKTLYYKDGERRLWIIVVDSDDVVVDIHYDYGHFIGKGLDIFTDYLLEKTGLVELMFLSDIMVLDI